MSYGSQSGQIGFKTQADPATFLDPGAANPNEGIFMKTTGGALGVNRELLMPDAEIGGNRDTAAAYLGPVSYSGEYSFYARLESLATLAYGALGAKSSTDDAGVGTLLVGTHVITGADELPWLSIEETISNFDTFRYTDAKVNTLHLEADAAGYLMGTAGIVARTQTGGNVETAAPDWDETPMLLGTKTTMLYNGAQLPAKGMTFDINNNLEDDDFRLGSISLATVTEKRREITAGCTIRPQDRLLWRAAVQGSSAATAPVNGATVVDDLVIETTSFEVIGTSIAYYTVTISLPVASIKPFNLSPNGDDVLEAGLEIVALRPAVGVAACTVTIKNGLAAVR